MLNPQASTFSVGETGQCVQILGDNGKANVPKKKSSGNVRVFIDREKTESGQMRRISITPPVAFARSQAANNEKKMSTQLAPQDMSSVLPLTSSARTINRNLEHTSPNNMLTMEPKYGLEKNKEVRMEQDRHNLMGVASIWAPRPSEKELRIAYSVPAVSPSPRTPFQGTPSQGTPSPGLSPSAATFTSRSPQAKTAGTTVHPMLLSIPQLLQPNFSAPPLHYHDTRSGSRDDSSFLMTDPLGSQAWFCPMCENDNRFNTETCSHCDALNPNRSLIRAISQQQQHAQAFQAYPPGQYASVPGFSPQAKNMNSVSPMIIMSKLTCHVNAILKVGAEGAKLQDMLVSGDVSLCYAMGMRGLVGKEAINPWKCVGVEIPSQNFIKNVSKPPLGTVAGDWTCSCGRENWAKRSVCSRCFPGIEPEYKSLVFSKVKPIFDFIAVQEQSGEAQKDAEWLAAEERRMRHEHLKQTQNGSHSGPVIGKQFVADNGRPSRQTSRSPSLQDTYPLEQRPPPPNLSAQYLPYSQNYVSQQAGSFGPLGPLYHYPMVEPNPMFAYGHRQEAYAFQSVAQHDSGHQYSFPKSHMEPAPSVHPASSSRFSVIASSESASETRFSPFSRSGSQQAMGKVGFTLTEASSIGSVQTAGTSSSGKSLGKAQSHHLHVSQPSGGLSSTSEDSQDVQRHLATPDTANPFSPFSQPQLFAEQALQAKHRSAKKAVLRPTRSVSPVGHGRPETSAEKSAIKHLQQEKSSSSEILESEESASYATEESYVYALGSLLQDVHM